MQLLGALATKHEEKERNYLNWTLGPDWNYQLHSSGIKVAGNLYTVLSSFKSRFTVTCRTTELTLLREDYEDGRDQVCPLCSEGELFHVLSH